MYIVCTLKHVESSVSKEDWSLSVSFHVQAGNGLTATLSLSPAHFNMQKISLCLPVTLLLIASLSSYSQKQEAPDTAL